MGTKTNYEVDTNDPIPHVSFRTHIKFVVFITLDNDQRKCLKSKVTLCLK